jgi:hypothetical protein
MPNFDAGHYFLTALAPIKTDAILIGDQSHSHAHLIKQVLALMPTGERTVASRGAPVDNPFAHTTRTHFARFVVLDDVPFNGRVSGDSILSTIQKINPLAPQKVDTLTTPFLIFTADFDAKSGDDIELRGYATELWDSMSHRDPKRNDLTEIFQHCHGFEGVRTGDDFFRYLKRCQIETTLPFNDYWSTSPALTDLDLKPYLIAAAVSALVLLVGLVWSGWLALLGLLAIVVVIVVGLNAVNAKARLPFPTSPPPGAGSDLPTVLKALKLQRKFTAFAIANQGQNDDVLYTAFGDFIAHNKPDDTSTATQPPGVIGV